MAAFLNNIIRPHQPQQQKKVAYEPRVGALPFCGSSGPAVPEGVNSYNGDPYCRTTRTSKDWQDCALGDQRIYFSRGGAAGSGGIIL
ncbi:hypothetical protein Y1Q_0007798 [Alligator mississippiensis]|uniref:Uncharacterized protein n=1 Tax=Alligator mississippiensis TaxID=8496 RepID=A0A151N711_ALLMI|nr:hypothetical protein Y1Q_0007798 [Alligator mississippiensis]